MRLAGILALFRTPLWVRHSSLPTTPIAVLPVDAVDWWYLLQLQQTLGVWFVWVCPWCTSQAAWLVLVTAIIIKIRHLHEGSWCVTQAMRKPCISCRSRTHNSCLFWWNVASSIHCSTTPASLYYRDIFWNLWMIVWSKIRSDRFGCRLSLTGL